MTGLDVEDVSYSYGTRRALDGVSFSAEAGRFTALLGPNGAGKSTLFSLMTRLLVPPSGRIVVAGHDLARAPRQALAHQVVHRVQRPGGNAVGVDGDGDALVLAPTARRAGRQLLQVTFQVGPQQAQLLGVLEQQLPRGGGPQGAAAHDENRAHLCLQRPQTLRHRRLGDIEALGGPLEAPLLDNSGQAFQGCGVVGTHGAAGRVGTVLHYKCN